MVTLTDLAGEANLSMPEAWARLEGFTGDHLDALTPLSDADRSMVTAALRPAGFEDCGCKPVDGHTSPCLLAPIV